MHVDICSSPHVPLWRAGGGHQQQGPQTQGQQTPQQRPSDKPPTHAQLVRWSGLVADARREVAASAFFSGLEAALTEAGLPPATAGAPPRPLPGGVAHMVMWGLGSLDSGLPHIRYQLALAQLLRGLLAGAASGGGGSGGGGIDGRDRPACGPAELPTEAYDPVFSALDRAVLGDCGIQVRAVAGRVLAAAHFACSTR